MSLNITSQGSPLRLHIAWRAHLRPDGITTVKHQLRPNPTLDTPANMRAAARLLASVKPGQFLEAGTPTGLTGLLTHPSPRSALLYHYHSTLDKLKKIPESSVYRQSTEALTKHRLAIIEQSKPAGWDEWQQKIAMQVSDDPTRYQVLDTSAGQTIVIPNQAEVDERSKAETPVVQPYPLKSTDIVNGVPSNEVFSSAIGARPSSSQRERGRGAHNNPLP